MPTSRAATFQAKARWTKLWQPWNNTKKMLASNHSAIPTRSLKNRPFSSILRQKRRLWWLATKRIRSNCLSRQVSMALFWCQSRVCSKRLLTSPNKMALSRTSSGVRLSPSLALMTPKSVRKIPFMTPRSAMSNLMLFGSTSRDSRNSWKNLISQSRTSKATGASRLITRKPWPTLKTLPMRPPMPLMTK